MGSQQGFAGKALATTGLMLAVLMQTIDSTIANVALPHMQGSLSASQDQITWVLTSYIIAAAIATPMTGWLSLKIGRKPLFLLAISCFVGSSVLCGMATSLPEMVLFRFIQGMTAAGLGPLSQATLLDIWPAAMMPSIMSVWSAMVMVGPIIGPTLGGFITEHFDWRWVFYINVPVGALAFSLISLAMPHDGGGRQRPFDRLGYAALVVFSAGVQLVADRGPTLDWFDSREVCLEAVLALCGLYVFVAHTVTAENPIFHRSVLTDRNFVACTSVTVSLTFILYSTNAMLPSFMQNLMGYSAMQSGATSAFRGFGAAGAFIIVPWLARRFRPIPTITAGILVSFAGLWRMAHFDLSMTAATIRGACLLQGFGMGLMANPVAVLAYSTVRSEHRTEAAVFSMVLRTLGSSLGIALLQAMLIQQSAAAHEGLASRITPSDPLIRWALPHVFDGTRGALEALNAEITRQGSMMAYDAIFSWMALADLALVLLLVVLRRVREAHAP